ncbi:MAG: hypothetical protein EA402_03330 [Planctomycetota bacterium]|nr:MAG: hypothetical protein EA402_03330 [Planctomycetota bacterium]
MISVGYTITKIQARILLLTGVGWLAYGLYMGGDPLTIAWRAAAGALIAMVVSGYLLRLGAEVIGQRLSEVEAATAPEIAGAKANGAPAQ